MGEAGIRDWFGQQLLGAKEAIGGQGRLRGGMTVFYLLGPFFMLIERSPADAWLTLCGLAFLVRCVVRRDWSWTRFFWVRAVLVFWAWCLISASVSALPGYSLGQAGVWIRFPLFAFASAFWLARDPRILMAMLISMGAGMMIMSGILFAEFMIIGQTHGRLSWPYGDLTPGNYLAKAGLPLFCVLVALAVSAKKKIASLAALVSLITIVASVLSGERINFILRAMGGMLAGIVYKPIWSRYLLLVGAELTAIMGIFLLKPAIGDRFVTNLYSQLPTHETSPYRQVWNGGIDAFHTAPIIGIGPDNYRILCPTISGNNPDVACHTHPHNYYIQILGETGLIGLALGAVMFISIIWTCFRANLANRNNVLAATCFVVPLGFFFPVQSTADFFGQWNNTFMWSAVGFALAVACQTVNARSDKA